jgi:hypothetical protein
MDRMDQPEHLTLLMQCEVLKKLLQLLSPDGELLRMVRRDDGVCIPVPVDQVEMDRIAPDLIATVRSQATQLAQQILKHPELPLEARRSIEGALEVLVVN